MHSAVASASMHQPNQYALLLLTHIGDPALHDIEMFMGFRPPAVLREHPRLERSVLAAVNIPPGQQGLTELRR